MNRHSFGTDGLGAEASCRRPILRPVRHFALSAIGRDRPGIVAAVTRVLVEHGANVEDSQMGILRGHFSMTLVVALPDEAAAPLLEQDLQRLGSDLGLEAISLSPIAELETVEHAPSHVVTIYGADHPGILAAVSAVLAEREVNITDLSTRLVGEDDEPLYVVVMEVAGPALDDHMLRATLAPVASEQGVEIAVNAVAADAL